MSISKICFPVCQAEEKAVHDSEQMLADLRKRSTTIAPLKLRRNTSNRPITVESLCDWETDKVELIKLLSGVHRTKKKNGVSNIHSWDVSIQVFFFIHTDVFYLWILSRLPCQERRSSPWNPTQISRTGMLSPLMGQQKPSQEFASKSLHLIQTPLIKWTCK